MLKRIIATCGVIGGSIFGIFGYTKLCQQKQNKQINQNIDKYFEEPYKYNYNIGIIGGGIIGLATARELQTRFPNLKIIVFEKDNMLGQGQTGHNSGVIHSGIYYKPGSLKAQLCVLGNELTYKYCDENHIDYKKVGKLIVATNDQEHKNLLELYDRAVKNHAKNIKLITPDEIKQLEPNCNSKSILSGIYCPETGVVNWEKVARSFGNNFASKGGFIKTNLELIKFTSLFGNTDNYDNGVLLHFKDKDNNGKYNFYACEYVISCAGLYSDRIARMAGGSKYPIIIPFRGEYFVRQNNLTKFINHNIYPVPDPKYPFLGVHFTPTINNETLFGPNAVLAFAREGYSYKDINLRDMKDILTCSGFYKLAFKNWKFGLSEIYKSIFHNKQFQKLQQYAPSVQYSETDDCMAGVRAQAIDKNGNFVDDFVFDSYSKSKIKRFLHVRNAPSPGATSSLAIAKYIADEATKTFNL